MYINWTSKFKSLNELQQVGRYITSLYSYIRFIKLTDLLNHNTVPSLLIVNKMTSENIGIFAIYAKRLIAMTMKFYC